MSPQLPLAPVPALLQQLCVQLLPTGHTRNRHHEVAPGVAHQPFHVPLVVALARTSELGREQIVRLQSAERIRGLAFPIAGDLLYRDSGVVIQDGPRHTAKVSERLVVTFQKGLGILSRKGHHEAVVRVRQIHALKVCLVLDSADHHQRFPEVGLPISRWMR